MKKEQEEYKKYHPNNFYEKIDWDEQPLTEDGKFACRSCKGEKKIIWPPIIHKGGKHRLRTMEDEGAEMVNCLSCDGTGHRIWNVIQHVGSYYSQYTREKRDRKDLENFIKETSTCESCRGDRYNTPGGCPCKECKLVGMAPWGG